jgi:hypothetical protein
MRLSSNPFVAKIFYSIVAETPFYHSSASSLQTSALRPGTLLDYLLRNMCVAQVFRILEF